MTTIMMMRIGLFCRPLLSIKSALIIYFSFHVASGSGVASEGRNIKPVSREDTPYPLESVESCEAKVQSGKCNSDPIYMLKNCLDECFKSEDLATVGYYPEESLEKIEFSTCSDIHEEDEDEDIESCVVMAGSGECLLDPGYMIFNCAQSCLVCVEPG